MSAALKWYLDISTSPGKLVASTSSQQAVSIGSVFQGSKLALRVYPVAPTGKVTGEVWARKLSASMDLRIGVGARAGAESLLAYQYTWGQQLTPDADGDYGYWFATLNLNTTELNTAIGSTDSLTTWLEIAIAESGDWRAVYQAQLTVLARVMDLSGSSSLPTLAAEYYTRAEMDAIFARFDQRPLVASRGKTITLVSPDGAKTREIGVDNNGAAVDNVA